MQHASKKHATCKAHRCNTHRCDMLMQHTRRCIAPMQRVPMQHETQAGATCTSHTAPAHPVSHAPGRHRAATWLRHMVCLDASILPLGTLATRCMTRSSSACSARLARAAVQRSSSRWGRPFANDSTRVLARFTPAACAVHHSPQHACAAPCAPSIGRAARRNIPYHGARTRDSRRAHAPCCSRSSRP